MAEPTIKYESLPNIAVSRYEANKKTGHVGIDENGTVEIIWAFKKRIIALDLAPEFDQFGTLMQSYTIDCHAGNNYDFIVHPALTTYIDFTNFEEGQDIKVVVNNPNPELDALLVFSATETIKWLNNDLPEIRTNAIITFYKSEGIIYADIKKPYIGGSTSGVSDADAPINLTAGTYKITEGGIYYIYATSGIVTVVFDMGRMINKQAIFKIKDDTFGFVIDSDIPAQLDGDALPVTTGWVNEESFAITSDGTNLNIIH